MKKYHPLFANLVFLVNQQLTSFLGLLSNDSFHFLLKLIGGKIGLLNVMVPEKIRIIE